MQSPHHAPIAKSFGWPRRHFRFRAPCFLFASYCCVPPMPYERGALLISDRLSQASLCCCSYSKHHHSFNRSRDRNTVFLSLSHRSIPSFNIVGQFPIYIKRTRDKNPVRTTAARPTGLLNGNLLLSRLPATCLQRAYTGLTGIHISAPLPASAMISGSPVCS